MKPQRLMPTGTCWCGCGAETDLGSFFVAGHDKRAEARVIMEVFGGVPQFVAAFGFGPESVVAGVNHSGIANAVRLMRLPPGRKNNMTIEYRDGERPSGPLRRSDAQQVSDYALEDGAADFNVIVEERSSCAITVPFVDLEAVYREGGGKWVVRVSGTITRTGQRVEYVPFGRI